MSWIATPLGDICKPKQHKTISSSLLTDEGYVVFGANGPIGFYSDYTHERKTIAVTCRGATCGTVNIVPPKSYITGNAMALDNLDEDKVDLNFLAHALKYQGFASVINGAAQPQITRGPLLAYTVPLPPLDEQKRIAGILDQADALRRLRAQALDKLNTLGQTIFHEMFGDPLNDHLSTAGWVCEPLERNIHYIDYRGKTPPKAEDGIRLITAKNVRMGSINLEPMEFIESEAYDTWMTRGFPQKGDVLFTTEAPLGNVAILDSSEKLVVGQRLITMQPDRSKILSEYLAFFLRSHGFVRKMIENSSGSTVRGIKSRLLKKIEICYPPLHTQSQFAKLLHQVTKLAKRAETSKVSAECLFASLQHRAFRGEL